MVSFSSVFSSVLCLQTPFTFGLGQRAPYTTGERCLLCRSERKDNSLLETGVSSSNKVALPTSPKPNSMLQLPLWVCPDCRRTNQDFLLHMPVGNSGSLQESVGGGRLAVGAQTPPTPDLSAPAATETVCSCEACNERREISAESERESQQLQNYWSEVRYMVRCIYRQTGTPLAEDQDQPLDRDKEGMKELVDRLCEKDPYQLYQRLEQQAREYVLEMKVRLLKHLSVGSKAASAVQGPPQAHQFVSLLLEEYSALCQAARTISTFLLTLENEHLKKFQVTWELHNKHLFENLVFSEPLLHNSLPTLVAQLRRGTASHDSYSEDMYSGLLQSYHQLDQEMNVVAVKWLECEKRIDDYVDEQLLFKVEGQNHTNQRTEPHKSLISKNMSLKSKQRMLKEDWEFFKQRRFIEEQLTNSKKSLTGDSNFTDTMRHMLSSRLSIPDCPNCNYRRRCTCDDCSLSHILTCGIMDSPITNDLHVTKSPLQGESAPDYLSEVHPPSMSSASSGSGSSSPITIQQHPRLILADSSTAPTYGSDDDDVPPLSAKFSDIYPLSNYDDAEVVASMNGLHGQLNGGGENMALKDESPRGSSSSSSSSSEADDEEADGESGGEPPGPQDELSPGSRGPTKDVLRCDSPPPSYPNQQVDQVQHACECHVCKQEVSGINGTALSTGRLHPGHQFLTEKTSHPALHLYPHIHGHLPLHTISHLPRPLLHPTLYTNPPFTHNKTLPSAPTSNHTGKHQVFNASLQDHIYQNCFGNTTDWNSSLPPSLKFENIWETTVMENWNPAIFLQEPLSGEKSVAGNSNKKNTAKKKCLYNFQDALMEANKVVMATSSATSSVSCTATTVQSSEVFHNIGKEDHRHSTPVAPRNSPTGLATLPPLTATALDKSPLKMSVHPPFFPMVLSNEHCVGRLCPPAAPTSRNYAEMREKLRLRLTKRKEEQPKKDDQLPDRESVEDHRKVEDLLQFINSADSKPVNSSRAAKRARHKQKKSDLFLLQMEEKARLEAEARERERQQQLLEEQRRREEETLKQEILRLQELQQLRAAKKKKKERAREAQRAEAAPRSPQPLKESAQNALENFKNGKPPQLLHNFIHLPGPPARPARAEQRPALELTAAKQSLTNGKDCKQPPPPPLDPAPNQRPARLKQVEAPAPPEPAAPVHRELNGKSKVRPPLSRLVTEIAKKSAEIAKAAEGGPGEPGDSPAEPEPKPATDAPLEGKKEEKTGSPHGRKQLNHVQEERAPLVAEAAPQPEQLQQSSGTKPVTAESPQPKGRAKKGKKKKGDKLSNSIDDVFLPKDIDLDSVEMDETEREVEYFKRFCLDSARQTRQRLSINWSNFSLKKTTFAAHC
ncbi:F193A protein, partial [Amia calva]|nr:F193A protein [Amia calva]